MLVTPYVRKQLAVRRFRRDMKKQGYERVNEDAAVLRDISRGGRSYGGNQHVIADVKIDIDRKSLWVKTEKVA